MHNPREAFFAPLLSFWLSKYLKKYQCGSLQHNYIKSDIITIWKLKQKMVLSSCFYIPIDLLINSHIQAELTPLGISISSLDGFTFGLICYLFSTYLFNGAEAVCICKLFISSTFPFHVASSKVWFQIQSSSNPVFFIYVSHKSTSFKHIIYISLYSLLRW